MKYSTESLRRRFSAVELRNKINTKYPIHWRADDVLLVLLRKLHSSEAKWLIRMVPKTYSPARVPEAPAMRRFHFLLPDILGFQNSFEAAVQLLQSPTIRRMPTRLCKPGEQLYRLHNASKVVPDSVSMSKRIEIPIRLLDHPLKTLNTLKARILGDF
jgi:hypothetical protein